MMDLDIPERLIPIREKIDTFVRTKVDPLTDEYFEQIDVGDRWSLNDRQTEILDGLKQQARDEGLWNFFLPASQGGAGVSNLEYAHLAEVMARNPIASEVMNCAAPDTGNMEVLERYGSEEQKKTWLEPLLEGKIRSAFAMTEPKVASSDATNISTNAILDGDEWVINGEKHYISGAGDSRCKVMITMVVTNPDAPKHSRQSQILVPIDAEGVEIVRPMHVFGRDDAPHGHMHIKFNEVRVPKENIILGEGRGFEISQGRLGPGRIHHCMRSIGVAERALELLCKRALSREAFGKPIAELGANYDIIAECRIEIDMCRLSV
jgi:acyl-CoA dehydrogenase